MATDKRFLRIGNENLLERHVRILKKHFDDIIISANDPQKLSYLGLRVIRDEHEGRGPLEGLTSALSASTSEYNFVIAVDIPIIHMKFVKKMHKHLNNVSAVIPVNAEGKQEPLFAFYSRNCIPIFRSALDGGELAIHRALRRCLVYHMPMEGQIVLQNLNEQKDFDTFISTDL